LLDIDCGSAPPVVVWRWSFCLICSEVPRQNNEMRERGDNEGEME